MARTEARIKCAIWDDEDFRSLTVEAQWLYHAILEQKDLSLCGVLTWTPKRFAKLAANASAAAIKRALDLLRSRRYVMVDEDTDELLVRTFITGDRVLDNPNSILGMSNAFGAIHSQALRDAVVDRLGEGFLEGLPDLFPKGLPKGFHDRLGKPFVKALALACAGAPPRAPVPPASCLLPPSSSSPPAHAGGGELAGEANSASPEGAEEEELRGRVGTAVRLVAERRLAAREGPPITDASRWLRKVRAEVEAEHGEELRRLAVEGLPPKLMADRIAPSPASPYPAAGEEHHPVWSDDDVTTDEHGRLVVVRSAG